MNNKLTFGKHEGKTFEWIFFNDPSYTNWPYENGIYRQEHFGEEEGDHFANLFERAINLGGACSVCKCRPVTRMALATSFKHGELRGVSFHCDECTYQGGSRTGYYAPAFFVEAYTLKPGEQKMVVSEIKRHYMGTGNPTQVEMEVFFHNDQNFTLP